MKKIALALVLFAPIVMHAAGNYKAGEEKATACAACHGPKGVSSNPQWPSLAGQHANYLYKQLMDFKSGGSRPSAVMSPLVANLSTEDMADLAAFYAAQPLPSAITPQEYLKKGEKIYRGGDFEKKITACIACHGPQGLGNAQAMFPVLSGQQALYSVQQLEAFKSAERRNDFNATMRDISARMSKEDMEAVAYYVAGLH